MPREIKRGVEKWGEKGTGRPANPFQTSRGGRHYSLFFDIDHLFHAHIRSVIMGNCWCRVRQNRKQERYDECENSHRYKCTSLGRITKNNCCRGQVQSVRQASKQAGKQTSRQAGKQTSRQAGKQAGRQASYSPCHGAAPCRKDQSTSSSHRKIVSGNANLTKFIEYQNL